MRALTDLVDSRGGFARTRELLAAGATERMLTLAVRTSALRRARNGWYSTRDERDPEYRAVRVGGVLTGMSALRLLGAWDWRSTQALHIAVRLGDSRLRRASPGRRRLRGRDAEPGVRIHWTDAPIRGSTPVTSASVADALVRVALDETLETAVVAFDWAWRADAIDELDFEGVLARLPSDLRRLLRELVDRRSESPIESVARLRLRLAGHDVVSQITLAAPGAVDLVVDGTVALELDGRAGHASAFERDRFKDLEITAAGLHAIRASATGVRDHWRLVTTAVSRALHERAVPPPVARRPRIGSPNRPRPRHCAGRSARSVRDPWERPAASARRRSATALSVRAAP